MGQNQRFIKGLFKDTGHLDQPKSTWRYAINALINPVKGAVSNEPGTVIEGVLPPNHVVIGAIEVSDGRVVLFLKSTESGSLQLGTGEYAQSKSVIGVWEKPDDDADENAFKILYNPNIQIYPHLDLGFSVNYLIEGTFKIDSKGDLIVYFTDDLNPPRAFNVSRQERSLTEIVPGVFSTGNLYGMEPTTTNLNQIFLLNLFPHTGDVAAIAPEAKIREGGNLRTGVYYLAVAYVGEDLVATNYMSVSNPVSIVDEAANTVPTNKIDGGRAGNQTSKSIEWTITNLSTVDYKYIRPAIIRKMGEATDAFQLKDTIVKPGATTIVFSGTEGASTAAVNSIMIDTVAYDTAKTLNQLDGVLYVGNTTGSKDIGYQKWANYIKIESTTYNLNNFDTFYASVDNLMTGWGGKPVNYFNGTARDTSESPSYRWSELNSKMRGYTRGEVYAFYIAFILKDGSMSYAYHIPGRAPSEFETWTATSPEMEDQGAYYDAIKNLPEDAYYAQIWSGTNASNNLMGYWKNLTEYYPDTDEYDVMDGNGISGTLRNENVRHHHFPGNTTDERRSITFNNCSVQSGEGSPVNYVDISGDWRFWNNENNTCTMNFSEGSWSGSANAVRFSSLGYNPTQNNTTPATVTQMGWNTADSTWTCPEQSCSLSVSYDIIMNRRSGHSSQAEPTRARIHAIIDSIHYYSKRTSQSYIGDNGSQQWAGGNNNNDEGWIDENNVTKLYPESAWSSSASDFWYSGNPDESDGIDFNCTQGDMFWIEGKAPGGSNSWTVCQAGQNNDSIIGGNVQSQIWITINAAGSGGSGNQDDVKIDHNVAVLGFNLKDIKIPKSIADKVQGFRIYRAKRGHANKTVLGQSLLIPMKRITGKIGMCQEVTDDNENVATHILGQLSSVTEKFYSKHPWAIEKTLENYPNPAVDDDGNIDGVTATDDDAVYKAYSFHDFNLLRTKGSLAPATYLQIQYTVHSYAWNGPAVHQEKRMNSVPLNADEAFEPGSEEALEFAERWGYQTSFNCYPKEVQSAIFMGRQYNNRDWYGTRPRFLGQKAKTYLLGDTIFSGTSLGFGGRVFNEHGESSIILGMKDGWEIPAVTSQPSGDSANGDSAFGDGINATHTSLVNPNNEGRHVSHMANLKAYKSDVYKSIDSQELVYTGYEFLEDELFPFVFDDSPGESGTAPIDSAIIGNNHLWYNSKTKYPDGIYGGDTFICRYGFVSKLTPSNNQEDSHPLRALYYYIVESPDNINFRHLESDESMYFPGTSAKEILESTKDLTHVDNIKYNDNYSADNNIKPVFPLPLRDTLQTSFPTRTHRSVIADTTSLIDNYRIFLANQYKDLPKNRGDLNKLSSFNNLLYFHMESSLYAAKGKQSMQMKDGSEAFVGSGDIFQQSPDEVIQTELGYGGTQSQWAAITTRYGYFFVDKKSGKVFLMGQQLEEISSAGMENWFRENLISKYQFYDSLPLNLQDNPTSGIGLHAVWDPENKRILLTFNDFLATATFTSAFELPDNEAGSIVFDETLGQYGLVTTIFPLDGTEDSLIHYTNQQSDDYIVVPPDESDNPYTITSTTPIYFTFNAIDSLIGTGINHHFWLYTPADSSEIGDTISIPTLSQASTDSYSLQWQETSWSTLDVEIFLNGVLGIQPIEFNDTTYFTKMGWTISYYPENKIWGSFHSYVPYKYFNTHSKIYSVTHIKDNNANQVIWEHGEGDLGILYGSDKPVPFIFEFINNSLSAEDTLTYSLSYTADTIRDGQVLESGFSDVLFYNTMQMSNTIALDYLVTTRKIGNSWKINKFRDMSDTTIYNSSYYSNGLTNVVGELTEEVTSTNHIPMFNIKGMDENQNLNYLDLEKPWNLQKKFVDKWIGIRLICDNTRNNLVNLYSAAVESRKYNR